MTASQVRSGSRVTRALLLVSFLTAVQATPSFGQYMYLDSNGDGINTAADQVSPAGITVADVWLDTDSDRDGSTAVCEMAPTVPMNISSYSFAVQALNGTIDWLGFTNHFPEAVVQFAHGFNATEYWNGFARFGSALPPGTYRLATVTFSVASGTPSIQLIRKASGSFDVTSFGSSCWGQDFDNTIKLGSDWNDTDGLPFGTGGTQGPLLALIQDMTSLVGEISSQALSATDGDGQPLAFTMASGPGYATVVTTDPGQGVATGAIHSAPFVTDVGSTTIVVAVTDGDASDQATITSTVLSAANHAPQASLPSTVTAVAGTKLRVLVSASELDGQSVNWRLVSGPGYARVLELETRPGGGTGLLELTPGICETGLASVVLGVSDGITESQLTANVRVLAAMPPPAAPVHTTPNDDGPVAVVTGDLDGDGRADLVTANGLGNRVSIYRALESGELQSLGNVATGNNAMDLVMGDFNGDSKLDVAVANRGSNSVTLLLGNGQGSLSALPAIPAGNSPAIIRAADIDRNGALDILLASSGSDDISILLGRGDGTFFPEARIHVGGTPEDLAIGDLDLDGRLDLAVPVRSASEVRVLRGWGGGVFVPNGSIPVPGLPEDMVLADWNGDGLLDLAVRNRSTRSVHILLAEDDGTYVQSAELTGFLFSSTLAAADLNLDGNADIVVNNSVQGQELEIHLGAGNGTFPVRNTFSSLGLFDLALGDGNDDGYLDVFHTAIDWGQVGLRLNQYGSTASAQGRAFTKTDRPINPSGNGGSVCIQLEPVGGSYENSELDLTSLKLISPGTGSVSEIPAVQGKSVVESDLDRNGTMEVAACFTRSDLSKLFDQLQGKQTVTASLRGTVIDGRPFCTKVLLEIIGGSHGGALAASVSPNPLNPRATLRFSTSRDGAVKIRMYDLHGRVVRTLLERPILPAGSHELEIDGRSQNGQTLASGIYFYEVEATEGRVRGRLTILK